MAFPEKGKKPSLVLAVSMGGKKKPPAEAPEAEEEEAAPEAEEGDEGAGYEAAAADIRSAMDSGDDAALAEALKAFVHQCM